MENKLLKSSEMLSAAQGAQSQADELSNLAAQLSTAGSGLRNILMPVAQIHTPEVWRGFSATTSRFSLRRYQLLLWLAEQEIAEVANQLATLARQAQLEADLLWREWQIAIYEGEVLTSFSFSG